MINPPVFSKDRYAGYRMIDGKILFFFQHFAYGSLLPFGLHSFRWEIKCQSYLWSFVCDESLLSCCSQDCLFVLESFFRMYPGVLWVCLVCSLSSSWMCRFMVFIKCGKYPNIISSDDLTTPFLSPFFLRPPLCVCWYIWWCPTGLAPFSSFFFPSSLQIGLSVDLC